MTEEELDQTLIELLEKGLITVEYTTDLEAIFSITDKGRAAVEKFHIEGM